MLPFHNVISGLPLKSGIDNDSLSVELTRLKDSESSSFYSKFYTDYHPATNATDNNKGKSTGVENKLYPDRYLHPMTAY